MKPEPRIMVAIMSAIAAYIQLEQKGSGVSTDDRANPPANPNTAQA